MAEYEYEYEDPQEKVNRLKRAIQFKEETLEVFRTALYEAELELAEYEAALLRRQEDAAEAAGEIEDIREVSSDDIEQAAVALAQLVAKKVGITLPAIGFGVGIYGDDDEPYDDEEERTHHGRFCVCDDCISS